MGLPAAGLGADVRFRGQLGGRNGGPWPDGGKHHGCGGEGQNGTMGSVCSLS